MEHGWSPAGTKHMAYFEIAGANEFDYEILVEAVPIADVGVAISIRKEVIN